jgi:lactoylglutathione lyase
VAAALRSLALLAADLTAVVSMSSGMARIVPLSQAARLASMELGNFSVSLAVRDIEASRAFYEKLGFEPTMGDAAQGWLILRNGTTVIGLFQGMFEKNSLTFNPGWDADANTLPSFTDVRELQRHLKAQGVAFVAEVDESGEGPGSFVVVDPDGNPIIVDQHV